MSPLKLKSWKKQIDLFDSAVGRSKQVVVVKRAVAATSSVPLSWGQFTCDGLCFKYLVVSVRTGRIPGTVEQWGNGGTLYGRLG